MWETNFELKDLFFGADTVQQSGFNLSLFTPVLAIYFKRGVREIIDKKPTVLKKPETCKTIYSYEHCIRLPADIDYDCAGTHSGRCV